jgi:cytochrome P450
MAGHAAKAGRPVPECGFQPFTLLGESKAKLREMDIDLNGTLIPAGTPVHVCVAAAALDPEAYPDPLRFDLTRKPNHIMVFGHGPHFCAGSILARSIVAAALQACVRRFPDMQLVDPSYEPRHGGQLGELAPQQMRMRLR